MKAGKLLLLGGSPQQVTAIVTAKRLGLFTVLCDYLPDNPGRHIADRYYPVSTTDREAVLRVAVAEGVNGVLAYASDPAAPTAAYVAEKLGLPTNPLRSVEILCNKDRFRRFLSENGFSVPQSVCCTSAAEVSRAACDFPIPAVVKPVDSSGSKGVRVVTRREDFLPAFEGACSFSRTRRVIIEEYVEKSHPYLIGGDIFVLNGEIRMFGLLNCLRDAAVNPLVPVGKSYPPTLTAEQTAAVRKTLQRLVAALRIQNGGMNVELVIDRAGRCVMIDMGPRCGGNMIPELLGMIFDVDLVEWCVRLAMGETVTAEVGEGRPYYATCNLHSDRSGVLREIRFDRDIRPNLVRTCLYKKAGDAVEYFDHAAKALGIVFLKFSSAEEMECKLGRLKDLIHVIVFDTGGGYNLLIEPSGRAAGRRAA